MSRYQYLFTSIDHGVVFQDRSGSIVEANAAAIAILGLVADEMHGRRSDDPRWQAVREDGTPFPGDDHPAMVALRTGQPVRNVVMGIFNPVAQARRWIKVSSAPVVEDEGAEASLVVTIFDDITEAWRTTEALRASEERFRLIAECTNDVLYEWDLRSDRIDYFGQHRPQLPTSGPMTAPKAWAELLHPDERDDILAGVHDTIVNQSVFVREHRMLRSGGHWGEVITRGLVLPDAQGKPARWLGATSDITTQRAAERAREESLNLFRAVIEISHDPIYVRTTEGRFRMVNAAAADVLGAPAQEIIGRKNHDFIPADVCARMEARDQRVLATGEPMTYESTGWGPAAGRSYLVTKLPLRDHNDSITGTVTIARDITEMKSLESRLRHSQKMEAIGRLAGGIAHDFNNLLTVIMGCCTDLLEQAEALPRRFTLHVDEVLKAAERAAVLTRQLLAFSRRQVLAPRTVDLNAVIRNAERMFRRIIGEDIAFRTHLAEDLGSVHVDPGQIEQVLLNLVVNARDAMPQGGRLTIETANVDHDETSGRPDGAAGNVVLTVSDTGVGMDWQTLANIYEPFFTTKPQGTGLGLSTVYGIVKQSGGDICAYSEPGIGTSFKVLFPRHHAPAERNDEQTTRQSSGSELIMLVEDERSLRELLARTLTRAGYQVVAAGSGEEALQILASLASPPALLITDLIMPGMDGRSLARQVREQLPDIRVLYISGYADHAVLDQGTLGAEDEFLQKPFTPAVLTQKVRALLDASV